MFASIPFGDCIVLYQHEVLDENLCHYLRALVGVAVDPQSVGISLFRQQRHISKLMVDLADLDGCGDGVVEGVGGGGGAETLLHAAREFQAVGCVLFSLGDVAL